MALLRAVKKSEQVHMFSLEPTSRERGNVMRPIAHPPRRLIFKHSDSCAGDITIKLDEFEKYVDELKSEVCDSSRPLEHNSIDCIKNCKCVQCGESLVKIETKRSSTACKQCGLKYIRGKRMTHTSLNKINNAQKWYNRYIRVCSETKSLLIPPPNYYPGEHARRMLICVKDALQAAENGECMLLDRIKGKVFSEAFLRKRKKTEKQIEDLKKKCTKITPQRAICYADTLCSKPIDRLKRGKENQFRNMNMGQVIAGASRLVVGTRGSLHPGKITLPTNVMNRLGDEASGAYICIRYPVLNEGNITFGLATCSSMIRATADVPSSQFKYNGADNDGDAFNFIRLQNGLCANASYSAEASLAPWNNMHNNGELKVEFDSDAKVGIGKQWKQIMSELRTELFAYNNSKTVYEKFCFYENEGRSRSRFSGVFSLSDYAHAIPSGSLGTIIDTEAVARFTQSHYFQSVHSVGPPRFAFNKYPVCTYINSNYVSGLLPSEYISLCQSTVDTLAEQKSAMMSTQGNVQYQLQYTSRPMILAADLNTVFNDITNKVIHIYASSLFLQNKPHANEREILESDLDFARMCVGLKPKFKRSKYKHKLLQNEVDQYLSVCDKLELKL